MILIRDHNVQNLLEYIQPHVCFRKGCNVLTAQPLSHGMVRRQADLWWTWEASQRHPKENVCNTQRVKRLHLVVPWLIRWRNLLFFGCVTHWKRPIGPVEHFSCNPCFTWHRFLIANWLHHPYALIHNRYSWCEVEELSSWVPSQEAQRCFSVAPQGVRRKYLLFEIAGNLCEAHTLTGVDKNSRDHAVPAAYPFTVRHTLKDLGGMSHRWAHGINRN